MRTPAAFSGRRRWPGQQTADAGQGDELDVRVRRTMIFAIRGLASASCSAAAMCSASLVATGCASSGPSRAIEAPGHPIVIASDSDCRALQSRKARLWSARDLPPIFSNDELTDYPAESRRQGVEGSVDLTFSIDGAGRPVHIRQVCHAKPGLRVSAVRALTSLRFVVPPDWEQIGAASREFGLEFQYRLVIGARTPCGKFASQRIPDAQLVPVCGRLIIVSGP